MSNEFDKAKITLSADISQTYVNAQARWEERFTSVSSINKVLKETGVVVTQGAALAEPVRGIFASA